MYLSVNFLKADIIFRRLLTYILFALHYTLIRNRNPTINHITLHTNKITHIRNRITRNLLKNSIRELFYSRMRRYELIFCQQRMQYNKLKNFNQ